MSEPSTEVIFQYLLSNEFLGKGTSTTDKLIRISNAVMIELVKAGYADFILLRDEDVNKWWNEMVTCARRAYFTHEAKVTAYNLKKSAWDKLTDEERKLLGLRKPIPPKPFISKV